MFADSKHQAACGLSGPRGFKSPSRRHFQFSFILISESDSDMDANFIIYLYKKQYVSRNETKIMPNDSQKGQTMNKMKLLEEENKRLLSEKQELQHELQCVVYGSPVPAFFIDKDHKVVYWNKAIEEHSGLKAEKIVGTDEHWRAFYGEKRPCMCDLMLDKTEEELNTVVCWKVQEIKSRGRRI